MGKIIGIDVMNGRLFLGDGIWINLEWECLGIEISGGKLKCRSGRSIEIVNRHKSLFIFTKDSTNYDSEYVL